MSIKDRKKSLFVKGLREQDLLSFFKEVFGELKGVDTWKVSRREGHKGPTYAIICESEEVVQRILKTKGRLKGTPVWIEQFKTKTE